MSYLFQGLRISPHWLYDYPETSFTEGTSAQGSSSFQSSSLLNIGGPITLWVIFCLKETYWWTYTTLLKPSFISLFTSCWACTLAVESFLGLVYHFKGPWILTAIAVWSLVGVICVPSLLDNITIKFFYSLVRSFIWQCNDTIVSP